MPTTGAHDRLRMRDTLQAHLPLVDWWLIDFEVSSDLDLATQKFHDLCRTAQACFEQQSLSFEAHESLVTYIRNLMQKFPKQEWGNLQSLVESYLLGLNSGLLAGQNSSLKDENSLSSEHR